MFKNIIGGKIFCGLDIGSKRLKASVVRVRPSTSSFDAFHLLRTTLSLSNGSLRMDAEPCRSIQNIKSVELLGVQESPTNGFSRFAASDLKGLTECIEQTISALSKQVGVKLKDIQLGVGGEWIETRLSHAVIPLLDKGNKVVSFADVKRVNHQARLLGMKMDEDVIHDFAQSYSLDEQTIHLNPVGLYARTMSVDMLLIIVNTIRLNHFIKALQEARLEVSNLFFTSYAAAEFSVDHQAKIDGCALIDIGANSTSILIFKDGFLRSVMNIPLGGDHATQSIAQNLRLSFDLAEEIKKSYGMAFSGSEGHPPGPGVDSEQNAAGVGVSPEWEMITDESVLVKSETGYLPVKREVICRALEPEITKLVAAIEKSLKGLFYSQFKAGIIMVGGSSLLAGLLERIEKGTNLPVRLGKINCAGAQLNNAALFSSSIGLARLGFTKTWGYNLAASPHLNWRQGLSNRIKELYQEYF